MINLPTLAFVCVVCLIVAGTVGRAIGKYQTLRHTYKIIHEYIVDCDGDIEGCDGDTLVEIENAIMTARTLRERMQRHFEQNADYRGVVPSSLMDRDHI